MPLLLSVQVMLAAVGVFVGVGVVQPLNDKVLKLNSGTW